MRKVLTSKIKIIALLLSLFALEVNTQTFQWARQIGNANEEIAKAVAVDASGNVYSTGGFNTTVDFDPGPGTHNLTAINTSNDIYISKLDAAGNFVWAIDIGETGNDQGYAITLDAQCNIYVTGHFLGLADFDPGPGVVNLPIAPVFVLKLDSSGNFIWAKGFRADNSYSIAVDNDGNVYTTGYYQGTVDFDPGAGVSNLTASGWDVFVSKLNSSGNFVWARSMGGTGYECAYAIKADASGNVYSTGYFQNTADFDPGSGVYNLTCASMQVNSFISKLDSSGNFVWAKGLLGDKVATYALTLDNSKNVYTGGYFELTGDFDPSASTANLTSAGQADIFVSKLDSLGNYIWAKRMGGSGYERAFSIAVDGNSNVYTTGDYGATVDFDPGTATFNLTSSGGSDIFVSKLDISGNFGWAVSMGGSDQDDIGVSVAVHNSGDVYTTGNFGSISADFDPGSAVYNMGATGSIGSKDIYIHKLRQCAPSSGIDIQSACDGYTWIDGNYYSSSNNTATFTLTNGSGCDSVVTLNLTINNSTGSTQSITACDSYTWINNVTYTSSSMASFTLTNAAGCDSSISLFLTINNSTTSSQSATACDSYTWIDGNTYTTSGTPTYTVPNSIGCDSIITLSLTIKNSTSSTQTINACDTYTWIDGNTYTSSGTPTYTIPNSIGCDSTVTLSLTITNSTSSTQTINACDTYTWIDGNTYTTSGTATYTIPNAAGCDSTISLFLTIDVVDVTVTDNSPMLSANEPAATYQWIDCNNNNAPIPGETYQNFTATSNGNYAVIVTMGNCSDTSICYSITGIGINEMESSSIDIYPNPTNNEFVIDLNRFSENTKISITSTDGKVVYESEKINDNKISIDSKSWASGIYFVRISDNQKNSTRKLIKI